MHVGLEGVESGLALRHLLERPVEVRLDRFPLGEPLLELGHPLLREAQAARAAIELVEGRRELGEPGAGSRERPRELPGPLFQLLHARGRLLPQLGRRP